MLPVKRGRAAPDGSPHRVYAPQFFFRGAIGHAGGADTFSSALPTPTSLPPKRRPSGRPLVPALPNWTERSENLKDRGAKSPGLSNIQPPWLHPSGARRARCARAESSRDEGGESTRLLLQVVKNLQGLMRCSMDSPTPNIMVAVVLMPSWCAVRCTSSQSAVRHFRRAICSALRRREFPRRRRGWNRVRHRAGAQSYRAGLECCIRRLPESPKRSSSAGEPAGSAA